MRKASGGKVSVGSHKPGAPFSVAPNHTTRLAPSNSVTHKSKHIAKGFKGPRNAG